MISNLIFRDNLLLDALIFSACSHIYLQHNIVLRGTPEAHTHPGCLKAIKITTCFPRSFSAYVYSGYKELLFLAFPELRVGQKDELGIMKNLIYYKNKMTC